MRYVNNLARGLGALIAVALFVVGVPIALITYIGWPLPTTLPTLDEIQLALRSGINPQLLTSALAVIVWFTWAQLVIVFAAETSASLRGRSARRLPVFPGLQPAVAQLVAAITLAVATMGPLRVAPAVATPLQAHIPANHPTLQVADQPVPAIVSDASSHRRTSVESPHPTYRVGRHDTLWQVAENTLSDGRRWQEIRDLNIGRIMDDGDRFTETTDRLTPGWLLTLPDDAQTVQETEDIQGQALTEITVESGDNFWTIAEQTLKTAWGRTPTNTEAAGYWQQLVDANRHRLLPPHDPNLIYPDQRFELPSLPTDLDTEEPGETTHPTAA
jgi:nucleoid-associated protein YgaU